jgi:hypothetical protein
MVVCLKQLNLSIHCDLYSHWIIQNAHKIYDLYNYKFKDANNLELDSNISMKTLPSHLQYARAALYPQPKEGLPFNSIYLIPKLSKIRVVIKDRHGDKYVLYKRDGWMSAQTTLSEIVIRVQSEVPRSKTTKEEIITKSLASPYSKEY